MGNFDNGVKLYICMYHACLVFVLSVAIEVPETVRWHCIRERRDVRPPPKDCHRRDSPRDEIAVKRLSK